MCASLVSCVATFWQACVSCYCECILCFYFTIIYNRVKISHWCWRIFALVRFGSNHQAGQTRRLRACHEPSAEADPPVDVHTGHAKNLDSTLLLDSPSALTLDVGAISESFGLFLVVMSSPYQHTVAFFPHTQWVYDVIINNLYENFNCIGRLFFNYIKSIK